MEIGVKTPEEEEEERVCNLRLLADLAYKIRLLGGTNEQCTLLVTLNDASYTYDSWKSEYDRLTELHKKMKMRKMEILRARIFAWVNGHLNHFTFKIKGKQGKMKLFNCDAQNFRQFTTILKIHSYEFEEKNPQILYENEDGDMIVIASDNDLKEAVYYARSVGLKVLKLHLDMDDCNPKPRLNFCGNASIDLPQITFSHINRI